MKIAWIKITIWTVIITIARFILSLIKAIQIHITKQFKAWKKITPTMMFLLLMFNQVVSHYVAAIFPMAAYLHLHPHPTSICHHQFLIPLDLTFSLNFSNHLIFKISSVHNLYWLKIKVPFSLSNQIGNPRRSSTKKTEIFLILI